MDPRKTATKRVDVHIYQGGIQFTVSFLGSDGRGAYFDGIMNLMAYLFTMTCALHVELECALTLLDKYKDIMLLSTAFSPSSPISSSSCPMSPVKVRSHHVELVHALLF